jgi:uncharacterized membrane protein YheB (UPF0754 family)
MISDTSPEILRMQAELLSRLTDEQRLMKALNHSQFVRDLARRAIAKANPHLSEEEQRLLFIEVSYGRELAEQVRNHLAVRQ